MLPDKYGMPLVLQLRPSRHYFYYIVFIHLFAAACVVLAAGLPAYLQLLFMFGIVISYRYYVCRPATNTIQQIVHYPDGEWQLLDRKKRSHRAVLQGESLLLPGCVLLNFITAAQRRYAIVIFADAVDADQLRQLRVRLRSVTAVVQTQDELL